MRVLLPVLGFILCLVTAPAATLAGYLDPVERGITLPRGYLELGTGYRSTWGDFAFNLDGSRIAGEDLVPFRKYRDQAVVIQGAYGLTDDWEIRFEVPYVWRRFNIDGTDLIDTEGRLITAWPEDRTQGMGDARFSTIVRPWDHAGILVELKTATGADNFFPTRLPDARPARYIGSGQADVVLAVLGERRYERLRLKGNVGYRFRLSGISNYLLADYAPTDEFFFSGTALYRIHPRFGAGAALDYMHEFALNSVSVLDLRVPVWFNHGPWELRVAGTLPVYGKDYPGLFPEQLADPRPLLGPGLEAMIVYRWREE